MRPETVVATLALFGGVASVVLLILFLHAIRRRRNTTAVASLLAALAVGALALLAATLLLGTRGYTALTREATAARIRTIPIADQRFVAHFEFPDGRLEAFEIAGDELYVDAHILKWKPLINLLGLHTAYELSRVTGRYVELDDERRAERTVHSLAPSRAVDLFHLRRATPLLAPIVDARYGSASFAAIRDTAVWELRVSSSGLLLRKLEPSSTGGSE